MRPLHFNFIRITCNSLVPRANFKHSISTVLPNVIIIRNPCAPNFNQICFNRLCHVNTSTLIGLVSRYFIRSGTIAFIAFPVVSTGTPAEVKG